jgi:hypothetical protein
LERIPAHQHSVQHHPTAPDVSCLAVVLLALQDFRSHVCEGALSMTEAKPNHSLSRHAAGQCTQSLHRQCTEYLHIMQDIVPMYRPCDPCTQPRDPCAPFAQS